MRPLLFEHYRTAKQSLVRARMRTALTMTGVAIGVASITTILALSNGITNIINDQVKELGSSVAVIRPVSKQSSLQDLANPTPQNAYTTSPLTERDVESIYELKDTQAVAPLMTLSGSVRKEGASPERSSILATTPDFADIAKLKMSDGQFIDTVTLEDTAVIGTQLAVDLFGTEDAIGKTFLIRGQSFTVIGIMKRQNDPINYNNIDLDSAAIISFESGKLFNSGVAQIQQINVKAKPGVAMADFKQKITNLLRANHDHERDVAVYTGSSIAKPTSRLFSVISTVMSLIAGISLLVGGIGIMNIMLVSISERTREIGLRKAVGASNRTIILQFMIEALIISVIGGFAGFIGGYVIAFGISMFLTYDPAFSWAIVGWASALSVGVGVLFGLYPAIRASSKDPIESLRRYH